MRTAFVVVLIALCGCGDMWIPEIADVWDDDTSGTTLHWQNPAASDTYSWSRARSYCDRLESAGESEWRLPTISELRSLIRGCSDNVTGGLCGVTDSCLRYSSCHTNCGPCSSMAGPAPDGCYWDSELRGTCAWYWSSSPDEGDDGLAWGVGFVYGYVGSYSKDGGSHVCCVR